MKHTQARFIGQKGVTIATGTWIPDDESPRAAIILVHGYGEHMGRYSHVIEALVQHGYIVYALDHRGHGKSGGLRAHVDRFDDFVDDLHLLVQRVRYEQRQLPVFMVGQSMGGLISTRYALRHQDALAGLIVTAPALIIGADVSPFIKRMARLLATLLPKQPLIKPTKSSESILSRDPEIDQGWQNDPLCYKGKARPRLSYEFMLAGMNARARAHELKLPLLVMYGDCDTFVGGAQELFEQAQSEDKTLRVWQECRHEIFNELDKDEVIAFMLAWLNARVPKASHQPLLEAV
jgi:acylglycerol lipase